MSGPNTNYDPVQVSALDEASVFDMRDAALAAINAAIDLAGLKEVRSSHVGDRSPLALAKSERYPRRRARMLAPALAGRERPWPKHSRPGKPFSKTRPKNGCCSKSG